MTPFDDRMQALRERFRARAEGDRIALGQALERRDRGEMQRLAHGLAGTGGTFGFPEISEAALALEDRLDAGADAQEIETSCSALLETLARLG